MITQSLDVILNYKQILDLDWGPREKSCPGAPHALKTALGTEDDGRALWRTYAHQGAKMIKSVSKSHPSHVTDWLDLPSVSYSD